MPCLRVVVGLVVGIVACSSATGVRDDAREMRSELDGCATNDTCVIIAGRKGDCTGVLGCDFAVRSDHKAEAEQRATDLAEKSRGYSSCASALCAGGTTAVCDRDLHRCVVK